MDILDRHSCICYTAVGVIKTELRVLQYFLAVTREESILGAAKSLHLSQPTLSRQLHELEEELGKPLFIRSNRKIALTEEGMMLRKRAEEILELVRRAEDEIALSDEHLAGDVTIGAAEAEGVRFLAHAAERMRDEYPLVRFHIISGDSAAVLEDLDRGLVDFGFVLGEADAAKYESIAAPYRPTFGVLVREDDPLAARASIAPEELYDLPLIVSRQMLRTDDLRRIMRCGAERLNIAATHNLLHNGAMLVDEGMGCAVCLEGVVDVSGTRPLRFVPFSEQPDIRASVIWKKYRVFSRAAERFLAELRSRAGA